MSTYIDLLDRDRFAHGVPHEWFAELRRERPVFHHPEPDGPGFWVLTRHRDVVAAGRQWQTFSSDADRGGVVGLEEPTPEEAAIRTLQTSFGKNILVMDPPDHTRYRRLVSKGFTPRFIASLQDRIRSRAVQILEAAITKGDADFVVDVAAELPLQAIAELLGVPEEDRHRLFDWSNRIIGNSDPEYVGSAERRHRGRDGAVRLLQPAGQRRRANPPRRHHHPAHHRDSTATRLAAHEFETFCLILTVAGNETTRNATSHGMHALLQHPDQMAAAAGRTRGCFDRHEEILRWATPVIHFRRTATADTEIGGQAIAEGDKVSLCYTPPTATRTSSTTPTGSTSPVLPTTTSPSAAAPHFCLGANLARLELEIQSLQGAAAPVEVDRAGRRRRRASAPTSSTASNISRCASSGRRPEREETHGTRSIPARGACRSRRPSSGGDHGGSTGW